MKADESAHRLYRSPGYTPEADESAQRLNNSPGSTSKGVASSSSKRPVSSISSPMRSCLSGGLTEASETMVCIKNTAMRHKRGGTQNQKMVRRLGGAPPLVAESKGGRTPECTG